jgi:hypothetical protein
MKLTLNKPTCIGYIDAMEVVMVGIKEIGVLNGMAKFVKNIRLFLELN